MKQIWAVILGGVFIPWLSASNPSQTEPELGDILQKYEAAMGQAWSKVNGLRMKGIYTIYGREMELLMVWERPNRVAVFLVGDEIKVNYAYDGKVIRRWQPASGPPTIDDSAASGVFYPALADFQGQLFQAAEKGFTVQFSGKQTFEGQAVLALSLNRSGDDPEEWLLDPETYLPIKRSNRVVRRNRIYRQVLLYEDYRWVEGIRIPFYFEREDYQHVRQFTLEQVEINPTFTKEERAGLSGWPDEGEAEPPPPNP